MGKEDNSGFEFNTSFSGLKWLRFDTELNVFYSRFLTPSAARTQYFLNCDQG
ncbi:MAG: hypothetical protein IPL23_31755 [Saprospiraceae bacterium]|nr:hypothetical protein [Saprospiraceae bacterium]